MPNHNLVSGNAELPETAENNFQVIGQERVPPTVQSRFVKKRKYIYRFKF
jgi:hypothetical protein